MLLRWSGWFVLTNGFLAVLIALLYLRFAQLESFEAKVYALLALPGHVGLLPIAALLLLWPLALLLPYRRLDITIAVLLATLAQLVLLADTEVFAQYRFHLSGFILDMFWNAGSDLFSLTWTLVLTLVIVILATIIAEIALAALSWILARRPRRGAGFAVVTVLALMQVGMHGWHAWASANFRGRITSFDRLLPIFYPLTAYDFLLRRGWVDETRRLARAELDGSTAQGALKYPLAALNCDPPKGKDRLNLLIVAVDAWRADTMSESTSPNVMRFARGPQVIRFADHISGGNSTQAGIFSLFYGLPHTYWEVFSSTQRPPVLIDELQRAGYQLEVLGSAKLTRPPFDRVIFPTVEGLRTITPGSTAYEQDERITGDFLSFLDGRDAETPFFGFLLYNAVHNYEVPPDFPQPFQPAWTEANKLALGPDFEPTPYFNLYKNAVRFVDSQIGRLLADLEQKRLLDNTVVMITSDHGQEFNENGQNFWGHGSNYTDFQVHVPMLLRWPGQQAREVPYTTTHMDVAPTLLQSLLGCQAPPETYSIGRSLFSDEPRKWLLIGSYYDYGIRTDNHIIQAYRTGGYDVLDEKNRPVENYELDGTTAKEVFGAMSRFYE